MLLAIMVIVTMEIGMQVILWGIRASGRLFWRFKGEPAELYYEEEREVKEVTPKANLIKMKRYYEDEDGNIWEDDEGYEMVHVPAENTESHTPTYKAKHKTKPEHLSIIPGGTTRKQPDKNDGIF